MSVVFPVKTLTPRFWLGALALASDHLKNGPNTTLYLGKKRDDTQGVAEEEKEDGRKGRPEERQSSLVNEPRLSDSFLRGRALYSDLTGTKK